jgi:hypothetical protein
MVVHPFIRILLVFVPIGVGPIAASIGQISHLPVEQWKAELAAPKDQRMKGVQSVFLQIMAQLTGAQPYGYFVRAEYLDSACFRGYVCLKALDYKIITSIATKHGSKLISR